MTIGFGAFGRGGVAAAGAAPDGVVDGAAGDPVVSAGALVSPSGSGSPITSASLLESGAHSKPWTRPLVSVSWYASPPLRSISHTWLPFAGPGRPDVNARYFPSGLQRGEPSLSWLKVICRSIL